MTYDVVVVGLGVMGSAVLRSLAARGARVLGIDRWQPPHAHGSSHGRARMIREAYFEHPLYVPLVRRSYELWAELEQETRAELLHITGGLSIGPEDGELVRGVLESGRRYGIPLEIIRGSDLIDAHPALSPDSGLIGVLEPRAGYLHPDLCVGSLLGLARRHGAEVQMTDVLGWSREESGTRVAARSGEYRCGSVVLAAGAWLPSRRLGGSELPLSVERLLQASFEPANPAACTAEVLPVFVWEFAAGNLFYGFPAIQGAVKLGLHFGEPISEPSPADPETLEREVEELRSFVRRCCPAADGRLVEATSCYYTKTPDGHFLIDRHPDGENAVIVSACSGHGFKFAPAIGEIVADLVLEGSTETDLSPFSLGRFDQPSQPA